MNSRMNVLMAIALTVLIVIAMSMFTVDQRQHALVFQLGEVKRVISEPGLNFKIPMIQNVRFFDNRILTLDNNDPERFITSEKKNVLVDSYVKWRIVDPKLYYISVGGDETRAKTRLNQTVNAGLREEFGKRTVHDVISGEREKIMEDMRVKADADARKIGVQIVDVRLKRVELPNEVSEAVYRRMETERKRVANELRSQGAAEAERTWTEGGLLTLLDKITDTDWWAEPTGIAGVRSVASDPRAIGVTTERTARVIETVIGPVVVEITTT